MEKELEKGLEKALKLMGMSDTQMLSLTIDVIAYKLGGLTLTQDDALKFMQSGKKVNLDMDKDGSLIYTVVDEED